MTTKDSDMNKLLFDNNTVKTHLVNQSDFIRKLGFLDKIFSKKQFFLFNNSIFFISNKVYKDLKANKARWTSPMTKKALDANNLVIVWQQLFKDSS